MSRLRRMAEAARYNRENLQMILLTAGLAIAVGFGIGVLARGGSDAETAGATFAPGDAPTGAGALLVQSERATGVRTRSKPRRNRRTPSKAKRAGKRQKRAAARRRRRAAPARRRAPAVVAPSVVVNQQEPSTDPPPAVTTPRPQPVRRASPPPRETPPPAEEQFDDSG